PKLPADPAPAPPPIPPRPKVSDPYFRDDDADQEDEQHQEDDAQQHQEGDAEPVQEDDAEQLYDVELSGDFLLWGQSEGYQGIGQDDLAELLSSLAETISEGTVVAQLSTITVRPS